MATTPRRTRKSPSTTTPKSSATQTEKPQSDSQESGKESEEISTQKETSSSSPSTDPNDELFAEADAQAAADAPSEDQEDQDAPEDEKEPESAPEVAQVIEDGEVQTFEVDLPNLSNYTFRGVVNGNTIVVVEDATRSFRLPGSQKRGEVLAHHKGQLLPLSSFERFIKNGK